MKIIISIDIVQLPRPDAFRQLTAPTETVCVATGAELVDDGEIVPSPNTRPIKAIDRAVRTFNNIVDML